MFIHRVIADQRHGTLGDPASQDEVRQGVAQSPERPAALGEDTMIAGGMPWGESADGAQQVGDGAPAGGEHGPEHQGEEAFEGGGIASMPRIMQLFGTVSWSHPA